MNKTELFDLFRTGSRYLRSIPDVGAGQPKLLSILRDKGAMPQRQLQEAAGVRAASASEMLAKLEDAGLIKRSISPEDRRVVMVTLTEKGAITANEMDDARAEVAEEYFKCFDEEEVNTMGELLTKLNANLKDRYGADMPRHRPPFFEGQPPIPGQHPPFMQGMRGFPGHPPRPMPGREGFPPVPPHGPRPAPAHDGFPPEPPHGRPMPGHKPAGFLRGEVRPQPNRDLSGRHDDATPRLIPDEPNTKA